MKKLPIRVMAALVLTLCLLLLGVGFALRWSYDSPAVQVDPARYTGNRAMAARLKEISDGIKLSELITRYWPTTGLSKYFAQIKTPPDERSRVLMVAKDAVESLAAGKTAEAVQGYEHARAMAESNRGMFDARFFYALREALAIAYLRLGEQQNCIEHGSSDSCLLPIAGSGKHAIQTGSRAAAREYTALLEENPNDLSCRWLLNIAYMTLGEYPEKVPPKWLIPPDVFRSQYDLKRFPDVARQVGVAAEGHSGGSIMEDFDRDGYLDIMASSSWPSDQLRYFRNDGNGRFSDRTGEAGLTGITGGLNIIHADYNNDGYPDVLVLRGAWLGELGKHPNSLLRNNGDGTFEDVTVQAGLLSFHPKQVAAWADYDNDGWVDLFVGNESVTFRGLWNVTMLRPDDLPDLLPRPKRHPCELFHNNRDGTFTNVAEEAGLAVEGYVKGAAWGDYDNDGRPDLYVSILNEPNHLFRNKGKDGSSRWKFEDVTARAGAAGPVFSFPTWFWDYDNDGWLDIFVADVTGDQLVSPRRSVAFVAADYLGIRRGPPIRSLLHNNRDGTFRDVTADVGLDKVMYAMGANFGDLDNDGYPDLYLGTGNPDYRTLAPNRMFRNDGGRRFQDVTTSGGFGHIQKGHGVAFGDIDNDGDQDIYIVMGGGLKGDVFRNALFLNPGNDNHGITLLMEGVKSNRAAIGARIKVTLETDAGSRDVYAVVSTGGSFGASSLQQEIGLGQARAIRAIEVTWPASGSVQVFRNVGMDQFLKIREGDPVPVPVELKRVPIAAQAEPAPQPTVHVHVASKER